MPQDEIERIFRVCDTSDSGFLEYTEFLVASANERILMSKQKLESAFKMFDIDDSGFISKENLRRVFAPIYKDELVSAIFQQCDLNGDGLLSKEEFIASMRNV